MQRIRTQAGLGSKQPNADRENLSLTVPQGKLEERAAIYLPDESTVRVKGSNNSLNTLSYHCDGIYCEGELTFEGKGKLKIVTDSYSASAIYAKQGPVTFYDSVEIAADPDGMSFISKRRRAKTPSSAYRMMLK